MDRTKWTERTFTFDSPEGWMENILERLRGTGIRIRDLTSGLSDDVLSFQNGNSWSIKQHIGHLADLEELHSGRLDDFINNRKELRAADMTNQKTNEADHNLKNISFLVDDFISRRNSLVKKFTGLSDEVQHLKLMHPRLQVLMRPVDTAFFTAEHDDHHLASIRQIISRTRN